MVEKNSNLTESKSYLTITPDHRYWIDSKEIPEEQLEEALTESMKKNTDRTVLPGYRQPL
jgi:biopolymer transport protein ExbD